MEELREVECLVVEYEAKVREIARHSRVCEEEEKQGRARFMRGFAHVT
jgi:hypothetical protein